MSEIVFLTYPVSFKWTEWNFEKLLFPVSLIPRSIKRILFRLIQQKIPFDDRTRSVVNANEWELSFNLVNLNNLDLIGLIKSSLNWWNINKSHSKTKKQTHKIQLNFCKIQVLMKTNKILWYKCPTHKHWIRREGLPGTNTCLLQS